MNVNIGTTGEIGDKWLPETVFMHDKPRFIVEKQGLNTLKTMSFTVGSAVFVLLTGGIKKDVRKTETDIFRGKETGFSECSEDGDERNAL